MKKYITILLSLICILSLSACDKDNTYEINITVPAGSSAAFVYSEEEISPMGDQITISSGTGLSDTLVQLEPIEVTEENAYDEPAYLTPGMPAEMDAEKGAWFKIGVDAGRNESEVDKVISVYVKGVKVRTPDIVKIIFEATVLEINDTCYLVEPVEGSQELNSADRIEVPIPNPDSALSPEVGDIIKITYNGDIMETYPARLGEVYNIRVTRKADSTVSE